LEVDIFFRKKCVFFEDDRSCLISHLLFSAVEFPLTTIFWKMMEEFLKNIRFLEDTFESLSPSLFAAVKSETEF